MGWFRRRQRADDQISQTTALVASSARIGRRAGAWRPRRLGPQDWQEEAWTHYEQCGEFGFVVDLVSRAMSRCRLFVTQIGDDGMPMMEPPEKGPDGKPLPMPFGSTALQTELLYDVGIQLGVAGDCYLLGEEELDADGEPTGDETWQIVSVDELKPTATGEWELDKGDGQKRVINPDTTVMLEIFQPNPRRHALPTSQARRNFRPLRTLERAARYTRTLMNARLAGPGLLLLPNGITFASKEGEEEADDGASSFFADFTDAMTSAIEDPDSVEALVPIVLKGPKEELKEIRWIRMDQDLSEVVLKMEAEALSRLGMGLDADPSLMTGVTESNHWSAWLADDNTVTYQIATKLAQFCTAVTRDFLWPSIADTVPDHKQWVIWFDTSPITQPVDRTADAKDLYDRDELSGSALRRESGMSEEDAPQGRERELRLLLRVAGQIPAVAAQLAPAILAAAGIGVQVQPPRVIDGEQPRQIDSGDGDDDQVDPDEQEPPERSGDGSPQSAQAARAAGFAAACEALVIRALETAGKRALGRDRYKYRDLDPWQYHTVAAASVKPAAELLDGAFTGVRPVAAVLGVDAAALQALLGGYVAELIEQRRPHSTAALKTWLVGRGRA